MTDRFSCGDLVRVRPACASGNPRVPAYVKGRTGRIVAVHGVVENPMDHRGTYPPLYSVAFSAADLVGEPGADEVCADLHEEWLEPEPDTDAPDSQYGPSRPNPRTRR